MAPILQAILGRKAARALLGRALGHFIFPLIGLKRILPTNIFQWL